MEYYNRSDSIDWKRATKTAIMTGVAGIVPTFVDPTKSVSNAIVGAQIGINAALGLISYVGTQTLSGENITLGGLITSASIGAICGWIGQHGWMQGQKTAAFIAFSGKNALKHVFGMVGIETLLRMTLPAFYIGGIVGGLYGRINSSFNPNGDFIGI